MRGRRLAQRIYHVSKLADFEGQQIDTRAVSFQQRTMRGTYPDQSTRRMHTNDDFTDLVPAATLLPPTSDADDSARADSETLPPKEDGDQQDECPEAGQYIGPKPLGEHVAGRKQREDSPKSEQAGTTSGDNHPASETRLEDRDWRAERRSIRRCVTPCPGAQTLGRRRHMCPFRKRSLESSVTGTRIPDRMPACQHFICGSSIRRIQSPP
jgi:hypothetical protein